ncbi:MAG: hypothetical protein DHS20C21_14910 [Gemmatimonadota bacterium]|nr:MAG: hypothetical protein DHS20C21_14910 [Gemmatimonadota bacterium]
MDPTGVGTVLGLTRMGEIKQQLAAEAEVEEIGVAAAEAAPMEVATERSPAKTDPAPESDPVDPGDGGWRDEITVLLAPDEAAELKLTMKAGERAEYRWTANGGALNFNAHGHGGGQAVTYEKGRAAPEGEGALTASFDGYHGWFWRNRTQESVTLTLLTRGEYAELKRAR